jgi:hypothetical protein
MIALQARAEAVWVDHFVKKVFDQYNKNKEKNTWFDYCLLGGNDHLLPDLPLIRNSLYTH